MERDNGIHINKGLLFRGDNFKVNDYIAISNPTLNEIYSYNKNNLKFPQGEIGYYSMVNQLCSIPSDMKSLLFDKGIDYEKITDFELFCMLAPNLEKSQTEILFGDLDFKKFKLCTKTENDELCLAQSISHNDKNASLFKRHKQNVEDYIIIDKYTYLVIVSYLRTLHNLTPKYEFAGTETTKKILIELDRQERALRKDSNKEPEYFLLNLISVLVNTSGFKYNHTTVWDLNLYAFMDSVGRFLMNQDINNKLRGIYAGTLDVSKLDKKELNWFRNLK